MIIVNKKKVESTLFSNGEILVRRDSIKAYKRDEINTIFMKFESNVDILELIFVAKHIKDMGGKSRLILPYVPYSRMDRTEGETVFTLKWFCELINDMGFESVTIYQPHSDVTTALLDRVVVKDITVDLVNKSMEELQFGDSDNDFIYYGDASAEKHFSKKFEGIQSLTGIKSRDFSTGRITGLKVVGSENELNKIIIVDDLCSRGGTFILGAEKLKELGAKEIHLVITHCENTILEGEIFKSGLITKVFTTNSIIDTNNDEVKKLITEGKIHITNVFN